MTRFHADIERELCFRAGEFVEGDFSAGAASPERWVMAAARLPAMVALLSDCFFEDRACGAQWAIFQERLRRASRADAGDGLILIPWKRRESRSALPAGVQPSTGWPDADGAPYADQGVFGLMRGQVHQGEGGYYSVVKEVAERILRAQRLLLPVLPLGEAARIPPAFGATGPDIAAESASTTSPPPRTIAISYVGPDQPWADWLGHLLANDGYTVTLVRWDAARPERLVDAVERAREGADRVVALLSNHYVSAEIPMLAQCREVEDWGAALAEDVSGRGRVVRVRVDRTPLPPDLREHESTTISMYDDRGNPIEELLNAIREQPA
ncbi:toll/interleukin-1 receptor domain-containing protein [Actinomadura nitritigenes]|uniref:toll/interleukin-1 receptor domain-containing protein n=1 Tax=Actinomadura nitritigenes TaxID=134602 RepID=UPI003D908491